MGRNRRSNDHFGRARIRPAVAVSWGRIIGIGGVFTFRLEYASHLCLLPPTRVPSARKKMRRRILPACCLFALMLDPASAGSVLFEKDVRPILKEHCFQCHGESGVTEGELDVRLKRLIAAGGDSGEAIIAGDPDESLLVQRVVSGEMPPGDKRLSDDEIETLRMWVAQGAQTARVEPESLDESGYFTDEEKNFWSFRPIVRPPVPQFGGTEFGGTEFGGTEVDNPIDAFVLLELKRQTLGFSEPADRATLIRRATFDLWGLPPDPEMVDRFVNDTSACAYENLVDRLLADPRYGERWGRHWLDVAGYADSEGYTSRDTEREFAYFYRDYVIRSFNVDKPLDQFVCEQLAGDEMGGRSSRDELTEQHIDRLAATGFLRMAPDGTADGSVDRTLASNETIAETINIVSTSLLGMTVGCAKCHDHRYDPITQADYYRLRAIFEPALDPKQWKLPNQRRLSLSTESERTLRGEIEKKAKAAEAERSKRQQQHIDRTLYEELLVAPAGKRESLKAAYVTKKADRSPEQIALLEEHPSIGNISNGSLYLYAEQRARRAGDIEKAAKQFDQSDPKGLAAYEEYIRAAEICRKEDAKTELAKMLDAINAIRKLAPKENFLRALIEPHNHAPSTHLFIRGDHNQLGEKVDPGELTVLTSFVKHGLPTNDPDRDTTGRRLAYAKHLTSGEHPLLARVMANRIWLHHFGRGIVASVGDFGKLGSMPTHPELLDWLASELVREQWQVKRLHRTIMTSNTYQQTSTRTSQSDRSDPENRWYSRMSIRRLESEAVRDAVMAASGSLIGEMYGPPIPVREDSVGQIVIGKEMLDGERKPKQAQQGTPGAARRSIYIQMRRSRPLAVLETFDIASMAPNCIQRNTSNVATQSLLLMNSRFIIDHAEKMARTLSGESDLRSKLSSAWRRCYGIDIDDAALERLENFVQQQSKTILELDPKLTPQVAGQRALANACQAMLGANRFVYVD